MDPELPTPENVLQALALTGGRLSVAIDEVLRLLETYLPGAVDAVNGAYGTSMARPVKYRIAPSKIDDTCIDSILVDWHIEKDVQNYGTIIDKVTLMVHSVDMRMVNDGHVRGVLDRAAVAVTVLWFALRDWEDLQGRKVWKELIPTEITGLPGEWAEYSGTTIHYRLTQNDDAWTVATP